MDTKPVDFTFFKETKISACKNGGCVLTQGSLARYNNNDADLFEKAFTNMDDLITFFVERKKVEFPDPPPQPDFIPTVEQALELAQGRVVAVNSKGQCSVGAAT